MINELQLTVHSPLYRTVIKMSLRKPRPRVLHNYLLQLYTKLGTGASFGGLESLYRSVKKENKFDISRNDISDFLSKINSYTLHRPARKKFPTQRVIVGGPSELHQADLMDMVGIMAHNNGLRYILVVIDCFTRKAWAEPIKTKSGADMVDAFRKIYQRTATPEKISSDRGVEFLNSHVISFFNEHNISHVLSFGNAKSQFVERLIRTLKALLWRYFTYNKTYQFYDILPRLMDEYNGRYHTSIHMTPNEVNETNEAIVFDTLYGDLEKGEDI